MNLSSHVYNPHDLHVTIERKGCACVRVALTIRDDHGSLTQVRHSGGRIVSAGREMIFCMSFLYLEWAMSVYSRRAMH